MSPDMEDAYNDSRREVRDMKQVDVNGDIPEKSNEQLAKEAKDAAKAQAKAPAIAPPAEPTAELPGDRIKATARDCTSQQKLDTKNKIFFRFNPKFGQLRIVHDTVVVLSTLWNKLVALH